MGCHYYCTTLRFNIIVQGPKQELESLNMSNSSPQNGRPSRYNDPAMEKYRSGWDTLHANRFVNNPNLSEYDRIYLRGIQGTWKVKQERWADLGYSFQIMLIWDQDRIWGAFDFGPYKGILMVNHGPERPLLPLKLPWSGQTEWTVLRLGTLICW